MLTQPASLVRHLDRSYASIWEGKPFWEYVPPIPLSVQASRPLQVKVGKKAALSASAKGGDNNYSYLWSPATRLKTPNESKTDVDTSEKFSETYTVTVSDGTGETATASMRVTVSQEKVVEEKPTGPLRVQVGRDVSVDVGQRVSLTATISGGHPPYQTAWSPSNRLRVPGKPKTDVDTKEPFVESYEVSVTDSKGETASATVRVEAKRARWKNAKYLQLRMTLMRSNGEMSLNELMIYNNKKKREEYYAQGDEFDGGELAFVHPTGGVVRRRDEYFIYPIGGWVDQDIRADEANLAEHSWLIRAAEQDRTRRAEGTEKDEQKEGTEASSANRTQESAAKNDVRQEVEQDVPPRLQEKTAEQQKKREVGKKPPPRTKQPTAQQRRKAIKLPRLPKRNPRHKSNTQGEPGKKGN